MCGQIGFVFGKKNRRSAEMEYFRRAFAHLLLLSQRRGPHAAGAVWMRRDGDYNIFKRPGMAVNLVRQSAFPDFLADADQSVTWLGGHTRWQTRGDASNNRNNHPIPAGAVIGTANGTIINADSLFTRLSLPRSAEVDSELIFRMADASLVSGGIDIAALKGKLALCQGQVSAVMVSRLKPTELVIIKGNKPLEFRYNTVRQVVAYSSDDLYLDLALSGDEGWTPAHLGPMTVSTLSCDDLLIIRSQPFRLAGTAGLGTNPPGMEEI